MRFDVLSLFPDFVHDTARLGVVGRAVFWKCADGIRVTSPRTCIAPSMTDPAAVVLAW